MQRIIRKYWTMLLGITWMLSSAGCNEDNGPEPYFTNHPLPVSQEELCVLAIGNSYTIDGTAYLDEVLKGAEADRSSLCVYVVTEGNTSLQYWSQKLESGDTVTAHRVAGFRKVAVTRGSLKDILDQQWDVVVFQQVSTLSTNYKSYNPYLRKLITGVRNHCKNPVVSLAWQLIPAAPKDYIAGDLSSSDKRWEQIAEATRHMSQMDGIDIIIPTGTAIQLARHSSLENTMDLTRDNIHLCYGVGRYIAACTWAQTLFASLYNFNITDCSTTHALTPTESNEQYEGFVPTSSIAVTQENKDTCLNCVSEACKHPYSLKRSTSAGTP